MTAAFVFVLQVQAPVSAIDGAAGCSSIASMVLPGATIVSATEVREPFTVENGRNTLTVSAPFSFCRVAPRLTPSADSDIHAEVWLPAADKWNGRFLGVGNGGLSGNICFTSMLRPLRHGYAVAGSDLGHSAPNADWALGHPEKLTDYAHRADHVTAGAAKAIVAAHTGTYFRLFMAPGVNHCGGGPGPGSTFAYTMNNPESPVVDPEHDALVALERWVETGKAPDTFASSHLTDGEVDRTRLLCRVSNGLAIPRHRRRERARDLRV